MKKKLCEKCLFYVALTDETGSCHRFPPIQDGAGKNTIDKPPTVIKDSWCGEFKGKQK